MPLQLGIKPRALKKAIILREVSSKLPHLSNDFLMSGVPAPLCFHAASFGWVGPADEMG